MDDTILAQIHGEVLPVFTDGCLELLFAEGACVLFLPLKILREETVFFFLIYILYQFG